MSVERTQTDPLPYGVAPEGYRLPAETRPGRVRLQVAELDRSVEYYESVLGLRAIGRDGGYAAMGVPGASSALVELHESRGATPVPRRGRLGLYHFAVLLPDRLALARFAAHLVRMGLRPGASDHRVSEALYLNDPDGLGVEVYADRPRSAWRQSDRELVMSTDPLDLAALMQVAEGEAWTGAPRGTKIGHVHLHVGDLARAEAFYHQGLGLDKVVWSYPGALFLSAGGYHHHLGVNTWAAGATRPGANDARLLEWELVLPFERDVEAALDHLEGQGQSVEERGRGEGRVLDPWGTPLRLRS